MTEFISLSNHVEQKINSLEKERQTEHTLRLLEYKRGHEVLRDNAKRNPLIGLYRLIFGYPKPPQVPKVSDAESALTAGYLGERTAAQLITRLLPPNAILIAGLQTRSGELDLIVISPCALVCIEVKNINGNIYIDGDNWSREKLDRFGNVVSERVPISDKTGRSPSQQVNAVTASVRKTLEYAGYGDCGVRSMVLLTHDRTAVVNERHSSTEVLHISDIEASNFLGAGVEGLPAREIFTHLKREHDRVLTARKGRKRERPSVEDANAEPKAGVGSAPKPAVRSIRADRRY